MPVEAKRCASCPFRTALCGTKGPEDSPFVIVGESPGSRELAVGKPFVGPSGTLLKEVMERVGFNSLGIEPYYINALNCYPAAKDLNKLQAGTAACQSRVQEQLARHPRKVILTLGVAAAWSVTNNYGLRILKDRGTLVPSPYAEKGVVLAVHPAYLLRNGGALGMWQKDITKAVNLMLGTEEVGGGWRDPLWRVVKSPSELNELVDEYIAWSQHEGANNPLVTGDIETDALHFKDGRILCLGITRGDGNHVDIIPENLIYNMKPTMARLLGASSIKWAWHNGIFDNAWLRDIGLPARIDEDTLLMSYSLNEKAGFHDLDQVAAQHLDAPRHKQMLQEYPEAKKSYRNIPPEVLYKYNAIDLSKQHKVWFPLKEAVLDDPHSNKLYHEMLIPAADFVTEMRLNGIKVNIDTIKRNEAEHEAILADLRAKINVYALQHMGREINPNSPMQLKELLYGRLSLGRLTDSTNEAALVEIMRRGGHPVVDLLLEHREVAKRKGTYISNALPNPERKKNPLGYVKSNGRVHADFKLHGTETGRLAGADPNLLNVPRGPLIRGQYEADEGEVIVEVDLNQAELRSLTIMSEDPLLIDIYSKNEVSIHDITTGAFFAPKDEVLKGETAYERVRAALRLPAGTEPKRVYGEAKMRGKAVNFGIVYGREAFSLAKEFDISVAEAQRWLDTWLDTYSGAAKFIEWCRMAPLKRRDLITVYGRKKRWGVVSNDNLRGLMNEAANFPHQSTASDIMLETCILTWRTLKERWGARCWNEVYDAVYFNMKADDTMIAEAISYVQETITQVPIKRGLTLIPFLGDAKVGYTWGSMRDWKGSLAASLTD